MPIEPREIEDKPSPALISRIGAKLEIKHNSSSSLPKLCLLCSNIKDLKQFTFEKTKI